MTSSTPEATCPACGGDGKETCSNPDHGLIGALGGDTGRLGCPLCGHDPKHKVIKGGKCSDCNGTGLAPEPPYNMDEVHLCKGCNTMKHVNQAGLCGRCVPKPELNVEVEALRIADDLHLKAVAAEHNHDLDDDKAAQLHGKKLIDDSVTAILALIQQVSDQRVREFAEAVKGEMEYWITTDDDHIASRVMFEGVIDQTLADYLSHKETK